MNTIAKWWKRRSLDRAQALIESYGLTIVKIKEIAGTLYIERVDGSYMKLGAAKKGAE